MRRVCCGVWPPPACHIPAAWWHRPRWERQYLSRWALSAPLMVSRSMVSPPRSLSNAQKNSSTNMNKLLGCCSVSSERRIFSPAAETLQKHKRETCFLCDLKTPPKTLFWIHTFLYFVSSPLNVRKSHKYWRKKNMTAEETKRVWLICAYGRTNQGQQVHLSLVLTVFPLMLRTRSLLTRPLTRTWRDVNRSRPSAPG